MGFAQAVFAHLRLQGETQRLAALENTDVVNAWKISLLKRAIRSEWCCRQHVNNAADYAGGARAGV